MKKNFFLLLIALIAYNNTNAQNKNNLSKSEKEALLKELKNLKKNPERLQVYNKALEIAKSSEIVKKTAFDESIADKNKINDRLKELTTEVLSLETIYKENSVKLQASALNKASYKVQIGAYSNPYLSNMPAQKAFEIETAPNGTKRYLIGKFESLREARKFAEKLRRRGAEAFVVGYLEGKRLETLKNMPTELQK